MIIDLDDSNFEKELKDDRLVLVSFGATWCPPCKMMEPILEELSNDMENEIKIGEVDGDKNPELTQEHGVTAFPTMVLFKNGQEQSRTVGAMPKNKLLELIKK